jgi:hypothetical protein
MPIISLIAEETRIGTPEGMREKYHIHMVIDQQTLGFPVTKSRFDLHPQNDFHPSWDFMASAI